MMRNFEQELKLQLDEREYRILSAITDEKPQLQTNYYFASENSFWNTMVRVREKNGTFTLCYKRRVLQNKGICVSDEYECEIAKAFASNLVRRGIYPSEINAMLKINITEPLNYIGKLDTYRTTFFVQQWKFELDKNSYLGKTDYELECECPDVQQLEKLKNFLSYNYGIVIRYSTPKIQRFFEVKNGKV